MDHKRTIEEAVAATREAIMDTYWQARVDNPVIEDSHQVNLGTLASRYHVELDATDLDAAIQKVNTDYSIEPPIQRWGSLVLEDGTQEVHYTSARGVQKHHIRSALWDIAVRKPKTNN